MAGSVKSEDGDLGFQIAPMVDVVFVLLLFFMAAAGAKVLEFGQRVDLPTPPAASFRVNPPVVIEITSEGSVIMNAQPFGGREDKTLAQLRAWLTDVIARDNANVPVVIRPAADTRQERVTDVLVACVAAGAKKVTFG